MTGVFAAGWIGTVGLARSLRALSGRWAHAFRREGLDDSFVDLQATGALLQTGDIVGGHQDRVRPARPAGCGRSFSISSIPFMSGIIMSVISRSTGRSLTCSRASLPPAAAEHLDPGSQLGNGTSEGRGHAGMIVHDQDARLWMVWWKVYVRPWSLMPFSHLESRSERLSYGCLGWQKLGNENPPPRQTGGGSEFRNCRGVSRAPGGSLLPGR